MKAKNVTELSGDGYLVMAGDPSDEDAPIYIGWAARDGGSVNRLLKQLRKQLPGTALLEFCAGTIEEVRATKMHVCASWAGHGDWFLPTPEIAGLRAEIRTLYDDEIEDGARAA